MARSQRSQLKGLEKKNHWLKKIVDDLELDNLFLKEHRYLLSQDLLSNDLRGAVIETR